MAYEGNKQRTVNEDNTSTLQAEGADPTYHATPLPDAMTPSVDATQTLKAIGRSA